jgi:hypothetical protein
VLKNIKKRKTDEITSQITTIARDIITVGFNREELFSGNIDARLIKETANQYGFSHQTDPQKTGNGSDLLTVKSNRNDLAHGIKSFAEVGKEQTADELIQIKNKVIRYLRQILQNIESYLVKQEYLDPS